MSQPEKRPFPRRRLLQSAAGAMLALSIAGADSPKADAHPKPKPEDVASIDAIVAALYDVISGEKGQQRDWDRFRSLFVEGARLIPCVPKNASGVPGVRVLSPDEFAKVAAASTSKRGFFESETARKSERFGHIAHVFSTYESRETKGAEPFAKGINSIQLMWDDKRWWVVTIFWDSETPTQPIPPEYQGKKA